MEQITKETFVYLFLDLEWNQAPGTSGVEGREPVQIGGAAADSQLHIVKIFSKAVGLRNPENLTQETIIRTSTPAANILKGRPGKKVFVSFAQSFPEYQYLVVWDRDTYELFLQEQKRYQILVKPHRLVVLQEVLEEITGILVKNMELEQALSCAGIKYEKHYLHHSKHDMRYLHQLFVTCYEEYSRLTTGETCILNTKTGKLHMEECRYAKHLYQGQFQFLPKNAVFTGFSVCKVCGKGDVWKRLSWQEKELSDIAKNQKQRKKKNASFNWRKLPLTEQNIGKICRHFQVSYHIGEQMVFIHTRFSSWVVLLKDNQVEKLLHENLNLVHMQVLKHQKKKCMEGYHKQRIVTNNFYEVVGYIKQHDEVIKQRLTQKLRVDELLEQVEKELEA